MPRPDVGSRWRGEGETYVIDDRTTTFSDLVPAFLERNGEAVLLRSSDFGVRLHPIPAVTHKPESGN